VQDRVAKLSPRELHSSLSAGALPLRIGPFNVWLESPLEQIRELIGLLYHDYPLAPVNAYRDFHLNVHSTNLLRRWIRPSVSFDGDGERPFAPVPPGTAFPMLEWGLNWRVATTAHQYLMLHAAVVERDGVTLLMPAVPGSGKSTLAASLMSRGWRLLSDEFGLVRPGSTDFVPFPRPIPLKNESIPVFSAFAPDAVIGPLFRGTRKGDIAHVRVARSSVDRADELARVTHVVFPRFDAGSGVSTHPLPGARAFMKLSANSFNYDLMGEQGFRTVADIIRTSECLSLVYGDLDAAIEKLNSLTARDPAAERPVPRAGDPLPL
jgi:hypothetical protein